jgi:2-succinyl-5-enolpyruvyl-6-hydroxy-3-cyclohexene-1-carboxylate synthase
MRAANPSHALAATVVDELCRAGIRNACVSPGSRSAPLALALRAEPRIRVTVVLDERSSAFMAVGMAKASDVPVLVVTSSGTAAANLHPAVVEADHARTPLLALTADRPPELRATGATQTIDQTKLFGDSVRWFLDIGVAEDHPAATAYWRSVAARAVAAAMGPPAGPVHLNMPFRDPLVPEGAGWPRDLSGRDAGAPWAATARPRQHAGERDLHELAGAVEGASRGVLVCGSCDSGAVSALTFAERAGWPVLAEPASGLRCGPHAVTTYDALLRCGTWARSHTPDLVIRVGATGISRALEAWLPPDVPQVLIDPDGRWNDPGRAVARLVRADPGPLFETLGARVVPRAEERWLKSWLDSEQRARAAIDDVLDAEEAPSEPRTARDVAATLPIGSALVVAASMPVRDLDWFMGARTGLRVVANRGANGIDGFVSTTVGVARAWPGPVAALAGDLSMLHDQNGLLAVHEDGASATFVVVNNNGGGVFSFLPQARFTDSFEELFATPQHVDFATLARLHDLGHELVARASDLADALERARRAGGVNLIEVRTDRAANVALHQRLWDASARAVAD